MPEGSSVVGFQGRREGRSAFALVNAHWSRSLLEAGFEVVDYSVGPPPPDFIIHHDFESHFTKFRPPENTRCIAVRTWDFGPLPPAWVEKINREFAQFWAYSAWIAEQARTAGVEPEKVRVVPLGIDPEVFSPHGPERPMPTGKSFRFLFVGGVSLRKGTDVLLDAYRRAFTNDDDVCLVIKDHSRDLFYREGHARDGISALRASPTAPEVLHIDDFLPEAELAALYRSCDVAVFPYRAEGFCLPILEAMACGTVAIVPDFGACLDFCTQETSYLMRVRRIRAPVSRSFSVAMGFEEALSEVDFCEVPVETLVEFLRATRATSLAERKSRARAGVALAHARFTWNHSGGIVREQLRQLGAAGPPPKGRESGTIPIPASPRRH